jgi:hypothetical protein
MRAKRQRHDRLDGENLSWICTNSSVVQLKSGVGGGSFEVSSYGEKHAILVERAMESLMLPTKRETIEPKPHRIPSMGSVIPRKSGIKSKCDLELPDVLDYSFIPLLVRRALKLHEDAVA